MVGLPVSNKTPSSGACDPNARCGNGLERLYPSCAVRYGYMAYIGEFKYAPGMLFGCGQKVVIQTNRGIEIGQQVSLTCTGCDKSVSRQQMMRYVKASGPDYLRLKSGKILRAANDQDLIEEVKLNEEAGRELTRARDMVAESRFPMKLVTCEHLFGGERVIFHFMSEDRVDFRELVRQFAHEFHTRIEMHQVGARDEARLVADYEICGRECCCKNFLKKLRPVAMRMAKLQKATLDPSKVSGRCGRLRCCLRYEQEGYETMDKNLPRVGSRIRTADGVGTVTKRQILTQLLTVAFDHSDVSTIAVEEVVERNLPKLQARPEPPRSGPPPARSRPHDRNRRSPAGPQSPARAGSPRDGPGGGQAGPPTGPGGRQETGRADEPATEAPREGPPRAADDVARPQTRPPQTSDAGVVDSETQPPRPARRRRRRRGGRGRSQPRPAQPADGHGGQPGGQADHPPAEPPPIEPGPTGDSGPANSDS